MEQEKKPVVLIYNLSYKDLKVEGLNIGKDDKKNNLRHHTSKLLEEINNHTENIRFPLIQSTIDKILEEEKTLHIDHIFFVYTDHTHKNPKDTCFLYKIIQNKGVEKSRKISGVKVLDNLGSYDEQFLNSLDYLKHIKDELSKDNITTPKIYINVSTGKSALLTGILLRGSQLFRDNVAVISHSKSDKAPATINIINHIQNYIRSNDIIVAINSYEYKVARDMITGLSIPAETSELLNTIMDYAHARINFDFNKAGAYFKILKGSSYSKDFHLFENNRKEKLIDWYYNTLINYDKGEYIDFLNRLYSFIEILMKEHVTAYYPEIKKYLSNDKKKFDPYSFDNNEELLDTLKKAGKWNQPYYFNRDKAKACLKYIILLKQSKEQEISDILSTCAKLEKLVDERNNNSHDINGISEEDIFNTNNGFSNIDEVRNEMRKLTGSLIPYINDNPYETINSVIKQVLTDAKCYVE